MNVKGLTLCSRYAYPPNALHLCGPEKQEDLLWYDSNLTADEGTTEILQKFSTLYPYLKLIAQANNISDPFHPRVVEAYWLGNSLLHSISTSLFQHHLENTLHLKKTLGTNRLHRLYEKLPDIVFPHHSFHVLAIYHRTGHVSEPQTIKTMDACIINSGVVEEKHSDFLMVMSRPLTGTDSALAFGKPRLRKILPGNLKDTIFQHIKVGDTVSYHWGMICAVLTKRQTDALDFYTSQSIHLANKKIVSKTYVFAQAPPGYV